MNSGTRQNGQQPLDMEIERDVAELRRLLDGIEGPREPHPAYWQNFLVHTRQRLDEQQARRRRFSPSVAWASFSAAALAVVLVVGGILPGSNPSAVAPDNKIAASQPVATPEEEDVMFGLGLESDLGSELAAAMPGDVLDNSTSLVLSTEDVKMLNAIMSEEDDDAIFNAMIESGGTL